MNTSTVRWVGFDMDECIGSVMPLYTFITMIPALFVEENPDEPPEAAWTLLQRALVRSELSGKTWLLRPAIIDALDILYKEWRAGKIKGAFIYSNNGSERLVRFIGFLLNGMIAARHGDKNARLFQMGIHLKAPCRTQGSIDKTFTDIQACLSAYGLPPASSSADLMFFDDMEHVLAGEIPNYVQVRPYFNHTSIYTLLEVLDFFRPIVGEAAFKTVAEEAARNQIADLKARDNLYVLTPPTVDEMRSDMAAFRSAIQQFFRSAPRGGGKTRRCRHRGKNNSRNKNIR